MNHRGVLLATSAALICGCSRDAVGPLPAPIIDAATISRNDHNVLSAVISVRARHADSVALFYRFLDGAAKDLTTPSVRVVGDTAVVPLLGLHPDTPYAMSVAVFGRGGVRFGAAFDFVTAPLPVDLPRFSMSGSSPSPGYVLLARGEYAVVIENSGRIVWYRQFPGSVDLTVMAQPTGHYVARPTTADPADVQPWIELDPLGNTTRTLTCANGLSQRPHDIILHSDGDYHILCDETRTMNLAGYGGVANARVTGTVIQHVGAGGELRAQWSAFDHFEITDADPAGLSGPNVDWTHGNALELDPEGNILASFRNLGEITKIDADLTGVIWRLGGRRNEFHFGNTAMPAFVRQHGVRSAGPGSVVLLDNLGNPSESQAERYVIDEPTRTAWLARSYRSVPGVVAEVGGSVQVLAQGRMLVSFGTAGRAEEYDAHGRSLWRIEGGRGYVMRAQRIRSLYAPGVSSSR